MGIKQEMMRIIETSANWSRMLDKLVPCTQYILISQDLTTETTAMAFLSDSLTCFMQIHGSQ